MTKNPLVTTAPLRDGVWELRLQRAPVNALNADYLLQIDDAVQTLVSAADVTAIVVTSPFKVFSAGMDLKEAMALDEDGQTAVVDALNQCYITLFSCPKPVVSAVTGPAIAGGFFFVLAADYRVGCDNAQGGLAEVRVGVDFPISALEIARMTLDPNDFRKLLGSGQPYEADRLHQAGILDEVVAHEQVVETAVKAALRLAAIPASSYAQVKLQMRGPTIEAINQHMPERRGVWFNQETRAAMQSMLGGTT